MSNAPELLNDTRDFIARFVAFPSVDALVAVTLWAAHAHLVEHFHTTPRLALLSPEPESGKTRALEVLNTLTPEPLFVLNASPAAIFRSLANKTITLLLDEVDAIFSRKGKDDSNEDLRALLNAGYKRGAQVPRCVGPRHDVEMFPVYCATAIAGIGDLPLTIMGRSVIVRMRRRADDEHVDAWYSRDHEPQGNALRERLAVWAGIVGSEIAVARPALPAGIVDRNAEVWEPLLTVADAAGGGWPKLARDACVALSKAHERRVSLGVRLLADLRTIFGDAIAMHSKAIITKLCDPEGSGLEADAPWSELNAGKPISERGLASMLKKYGISSIKVKVNGEALQGYRREHLWDAWTRYLPPESASGEPAEPMEPAEPKESSGRGPSGGDQEPPVRNPYISHHVRAVPEVPEVPLSRTPESARCRHCDGEGCHWCEPREARL